MVATAGSRAKFITSVKTWLAEKNADGIGAFLQAREY
jgi:hypothetical protein